MGKPKKGQTILISSAAGAVGPVVGQIAKDLGLKVIGYELSCLLPGGHSARSISPIAGHRSGWLVALKKPKWSRRSSSLITALTTRRRGTTLPMSSSGPVRKVLGEGWQGLYTTHTTVPVPQVLISTGTMWAAPRSTLCCPI